MVGKCNKVMRMPALSLMDSVEGISLVSKKRSDDFEILLNSFSLHHANSMSTFCSHVFLAVFGFCEVA